MWYGTYVKTHTHSAFQKDTDDVQESHAVNIVIIVIHNQF